jgi:hypothetical protein
MDFKKLLSQLDQLHEADVKHKGTYGTSYQGDDDEDDDKKTAPAPTEKRGRGRPKKAGGDAANAAGYSGAKDLQSMMVGNIPKDSKELKKLPKTKHTLKDWIESIDVQMMLAEADQVTMEPAKQNTQVIKQGNKTLGTVSNPQLAAQIKQSIGKGEMSLAGDQLGEEGMAEASGDQVKKVFKKNGKPVGEVGIDPEASPGVGQWYMKCYQYKIDNSGYDSYEEAVGELKYCMKQGMAEGEDEGKPGKNFAKIAKSAAQRYGSKEAGERVAGAVRAKLMKQGKIKEAALPTHDGDAGAGLGAGRSNYALEGSLNELSKKTLSSYGKKASLDAIDRMANAVNDGDGEEAEKAGRRYAGVTKAIDRLAKEKDKEDMAEGQSADGSVNYTLGHTPDAEHVYSIYRDGEKEGTYHSVGQAKRIVANMKKTSPHRSYKITRSSRSKMAGPVGQLPEQDISESKTAKRDNRAEAAGKKVTKDLEYDMKHKGKDDNKAERAGKKVTKDIEYDEKKLPTMAHIKKMCKDGKTVAQICKMHPNCNQAELKKMIADCKKKMVAEGMDQRLEAARAEGRAHGLRGHQHCGNNYDDMEEARCYHEGYKVGLDGCYGQMPIQGYVGEESDQGIMDTMAYDAELDEMDKTAYMKQQAIKTPGDTFKAFGQTMHDSDVLDEFAFESLDRQLNALLNEDSVSEGMTVSISKGQQGSPDSVSINASDAEADSLLSFVKQAGLGIFGGDDHGSMQDAVVTSEPNIASSDAIEVVDDHDGMLSLIRKMAGQGAAHSAHDHSSEDYADEEETCNECGMAYESCGGKHGGEMVDEMESEDQMTYNVAEDNPPDTGAAETEQEVQDAAQANSSAAEFDKAQAAPDAAADLATESEDDESMDDEEEDGLEESYANSADDTFESDIDFMTNIISNGLNKRKSTGQTTIPVVSAQENRLGNPMKESTDLLTQWKKLSGI